MDSVGVSKSENHTEIIALKYRRNSNNIKKYLNPK